MNENRDDTSGQYTPAPEAPAAPVIEVETREPEPFGLEGVERDQGYVKLKEEPADEAISFEQAVAEADQGGTAAGDIRTYGALPDDLALTIDQASEMLAQADEADLADQEAQRKDDVRKRVDELRGENNPAEQVPQQFDPEKALEHPAVKEAIQRTAADAQRVSTEAENARQAYVNGLGENLRVGVASFFSRFQEFNGLSAEQAVQAFAVMQQNEPARAAEILTERNRIMATYQRFGAEVQHTAEVQQAKKQDFAREQNLIFEDSVKGQSKQHRAAVENEIAAAIRQHGSDADLQNFIGMMRSGEFSSATAMRLLNELGETRLELARLKGATKLVSSRNLPPVNRPGSGGKSEAPNAGRIQSLTRDLSTATGDRAIRLASQLHELENRARG